MSCGRRRAVGVAVLVLLVVAACSSGSEEAPEASGVPDSPPEHTAPVDPGRAGEVLHAEQLDGSGVGGRVWRVRYRSEGLDGGPIGVTGIIARPDGPAPAGGFPILSYAHGTTGVADECAPSRQGAGGVVGLEQMLAAGYVVAATDYEGLGTPGVHPYLVLASEGRSVLHAARAAAELVEDTSSRLVVLGISQGGHAALAAASLAPEPAEGLELAGTIAVAPAADVETIVDAVFRDGPAFGFAALVAAGWSGTYPGLAASDVLTRAGAAIAEDAAEGGCVTDVFAAAEAADAPLVSTPPRQVEAWHRRMVENSIDATAVTGPVLLVQGTADAVIPKALTDVLDAELCAAGVPVTYGVYDGADHGTAALAAFQDMIDWAAARVGGEPPPTTCR